MTGPLPGRVALVLAPDAPDPCAAARDHAVAELACLYVRALACWDTKEKFSVEARQALHRAQRELVRAVLAREEAKRKAV